MTEGIIAFKDVSFRYKKREELIIDHLSFDVNNGSRTVLRGESGAGKTTIFRLLLGFEQPDTGDILFKGQYLNDDTIRKVRSQSAWLPQDLNLGSGTVESLVNLLFRFEENNANKPAKDQITDTFERLRLSASSLQKDFSDLSTGQRQRVGIAVCYLLGKPLILLDEPTSALDSASKKKVANLLFDNNERTILSASHDPWWIDKCDHVFELNSRVYRLKKE